MRRRSFETFLVVEAHRTRLLPEYEAAHFERLNRRFTSKSRNPAALMGDYENISFREALQRIPLDMRNLVSRANLALDREGADAAFEILRPLGEDVRTALVDGWQELRKRKTRIARARSGERIRMKDGAICWMPAGLVKAACEAAALEIERETGSTVTVDHLRKAWRKEFVNL